MALYQKHDVVLQVMEHGEVIATKKVGVLWLELGVDLVPTSFDLRLQPTADLPVRQLPS